MMVGLSATCGILMKVFSLSRRQNPYRQNAGGGGWGEEAAGSLDFLSGWEVMLISTSETAAISHFHMSLALPPASG